MLKSHTCMWLSTSTGAESNVGVYKCKYWCFCFCSIHVGSWFYRWFTCFIKMFPYLLENTSYVNLKHIQFQIYINKFIFKELCKNCMITSM